MKWTIAGSALCVVIGACSGEDAEEMPVPRDASSGAAIVDAGGLQADAALPPVADGGIFDAAPPHEAGTLDAHVPEAGSAADAAHAGDAARADSGAGDAASAGDAGASCPFSGHISYTLTRAATPTADQSSAYALITMAMDEAVSKYNCYTDITRSVHVSYDPSVATADGNVNGSIRFGARGNMQVVAAMHEISHVLGVGSNEFRAKVQNNIFTGEQATAQQREISGKPDDVVHSDGTHFWPNGLNYPSEYKSEADAVNHCKMVIAIRADLGL